MEKKRAVVLLMLLISTVACEKKLTDVVITPVTQSDTSSAGSSKDIHVCVDMSVADRPVGVLLNGAAVKADGNGQSITNAAVLKQVKWTNGYTIKVKFMNGSAFLQGKVKQYADQWSLYANIRFRYVAASESSDVRVNFDQSNASWSYMGYIADAYPQNQPTVNFGWFTEQTDEEEFSRTILHEFGHVLGMIHEHQNPTSQIPWDKTKVYAYYLSAANWSAAQVDVNIFNKYSTSETNFTSFDRTSIMEYPIPASLTTNGYNVGWNRALSSLDKTFISQQYPHSNQTLTPGQSIRSANSVFQLQYQGDGNLVLSYVDPPGNNQPSQLWTSGTSGTSTGKTVMQADGNLVVYNSAGRALWSSNTVGHPNSILSVQDNGGLKITDGNNDIWSNDKMTLLPGQYIESDDKKTRLWYQVDGNLVIYNMDNNAKPPLWASNTMGKSAGRAVMQGNGNLVVYDGKGTAVWASNTSGNYNSTIILGSGNLVISNEATWVIWKAR